MSARTMRGIVGKFRNPPDGPDEQIQRFFIDECNHIPNTKLIIGDVHLTPLLGTRKPDFVFLRKDAVTDALNVVALGEIRKRHGDHLRLADYGHAASFAEKLQLQPRRSFAFVFLTDCKMIVLIKVTKCANNKFLYNFTVPEYLAYDEKIPSKGWKQLITFLESEPDKLGWMEPIIYVNDKAIILERSLATGRTSVVYHGKLESDDVAVKIAKNDTYKECFAREIDTLSSLNLCHIPQLRESNSNILSKFLISALYQKFAGRAIVK
ncbi:3219_t:CDS:2 [Entrophospora sp. SA101]|nr:3219_t:CDS:2 [Entrophospora sp. SA101]